MNGASCLCLTYGRPKLLEEAIESFLRQQTDVPRELIVVNDHPDQQLVCDAENVSVINLPRRIKTLGEKRNFSASIAKYDTLFVWDDDDLYLPWRIEMTRQHMGDKDFFKCPYAWVMNGNRIVKVDRNWFHSGSAYTRHLFASINGYPIMNGGEDAFFEDRVRQAGKWSNHSLGIREFYYIYRWRHGHYHTTGCDDLSKIKPFVDKGTVVLMPHWKQDYVELVKSQKEYLLAE